MDELNPKEQPCYLCNQGSWLDVFGWQIAFDIWNRTGDKTAIIDNLRSMRPLPPSAREFLAKLIDGTAKRENPKNKGFAGHITRNAFIKSMYSHILSQAKTTKGKEWRESQPKITASDYAISKTAEIYSLSEDQIKRIVRRR